MKLPHKHLGLLLALTSLSTAGLAAPSKTEIALSGTRNSVEFLAVGKPSLLKIRGKLTEPGAVRGSFVIENGKLAGSAEIPLEKLDTGLSLRNEHMRDKYLQVKQYPTATLKLSPISLADPSSSYDGSFTGTLNLHGKEKPVTGKIQISKAEATPSAKWQGKLAFNLELSDFAIEIPQYMGITVSKSVEVEAKFQQ